MKSKFLFFLVVSFLVASCDDTSKSKAENASRAGDKNISAVSCYRYANTTDTITLKLTRAGNLITGTLVYQLAGKDKNTGTIQGSMRGDILVADYNFMSEGIRSTRQIAFKQDQNFFVEGWGDIDTSNNRVRFKDIGALRFNEATRLTGWDCPE